MSRTCVAFPGREAVLKGFDKTFYNNFNISKEVVEYISDTLHEDILGMCLNKIDMPEEMTAVCLVAHCYSLYKAVESVYGTPECFAGYSQGEFCACAAAGMFEITDALKLILNLERLLLKTSAEAESMVRVIDLDIEILKVICREIDPSGKKLCVSAYISNNQNIVSGKKDELKKLRAAAKNNGARWVLNLDSKRAYHSSLCSDAAQSAKKYFDSIILSKPGRYIYSCFDGQGSKNENTALKKLSKQITSPIQWKKLVANLYIRGINNILEIGPGCTVSANSRIAQPDMNCIWIGSVDDL